MSNLVIHAEGLSKRYRIGDPHDSTENLRALLEGTVRAPLRLLSGGRPSANDHSVGTEHINGKHVWALKDVSFSVRRGETLALIGGNGAGKSVLMKILARVTKPTEGCARVRGRVGAMLEVGAGFHHELTGRENIYLSGTILGITRDIINRSLDEIVRFAGIEKFMNTPIKHYSSGMRMRLAFAVAAQLETEILLVDEALSVADAAFREQGLEKMQQAAAAGRTIIFVSHDLNVVEKLCDRALWLKNGRVVMDDTAPRVLRSYLATNSRPGGIHGK